MPDIKLDDLIRQYLRKELEKDAAETPSTPQPPNEPVDAAVGVGSTAEASTSVQAKRDLLTTVFQRFQVNEAFQLGQHVRWKAELRNRLFPDDGDPAIVIEILDPPIVDPNQDSGSPYFQEKLDLRLGVLDDEGQFQIYLYDSRRFEAF